MSPACLRRLGRLLIVLGIFLASVGLSAVAHASPAFVTAPPACSVPGIAGTPLVGAGSWLAADSCSWRVYFAPPGGGGGLEQGAQSAEYRTSSDGGESWSEPAPAPEDYRPPASFAQIPDDWSATLVHAAVSLEDEGPQQVQFRAVAADGTRGDWFGAPALGVDRSGPEVTDVAGDGEHWQPARAAALTVTADDDPGIGVAYLDVRYGGASAEGPFPAQARCGGGAVWANCVLGAPADGERSATITGLVGDQWLSVRGCDLLGNCAEWGDPIHLRVSLRDGAGSRSLVGSANPDLISAGAGADRLAGLAGPDTLLGGAGADRLDGGPGADRISAGAGADRIQAADGSRDRISCGPGADTVRADRTDRVGADCERVVRS